MKNLILIAITGLAVGVMSRRTQAIEATNYSSRQGVIGAAAATPVPQASVLSVQDQSTRSSLLAAGRGGSAIQEQPVSLAYYNTKTASRGERVMEIELAPLK